MGKALAVQTPGPHPEALESSQAQWCLSVIPCSEGERKAADRRSPGDCEPASLVYSIKKSHLKTRWKVSRAPKVPLTLPTHCGKSTHTQ